MAHNNVPREEIERNPVHSTLNAKRPLSIMTAACNTKESFFASTSSWGPDHLDALRVLLFDNLPLSRIYPSPFQISHNSRVAKEVERAFNLSTDDVKAGRFSIHDNFYTFYSELSLLLRTDRKTPSQIVKETTPKQHVPFFNVSASEQSRYLNTGMSLSDSSRIPFYISPIKSSKRRSRDSEQIVLDNVNAREAVSNNLMIAFFRALSNIVYPQVDPTQPRPEFNAYPDSIPFLLYGDLLTSINDGSGWKTRFSKSENQWVHTGGAPLITLKVRRSRVFVLNDRQNGIRIIWILKRSWLKKLANYLRFCV